MNRFRLCLVLCLTAFVWTAAGQKVELIETGEFHGEEITSVSGETWHGLFRRGESFQLLPTVISVGRVHDPIVDEPGEMTGKSVRAEGSDEAVFLVRGLAPGSSPLIETVFFGEQDLNGGSDMKFSLGGASYRLRVDNGDLKDRFIGKGSRLILSVGGRKQVLRHLTDDVNDAFWTLRWAGDLNGDGRLDLYLDLPDHYNVSDRRLFLSAADGGKRPVTEVARFVTVGC